MSPLDLLMLIRALPRTYIMPVRPMCRSAAHAPPLPPTPSPRGDAGGNHPAHPPRRARSRGEPKPSTTGDSGRSNPTQFARPLRCPVVEDHDSGRSTTLRPILSLVFGPKATSSRPAPHLTAVSARWPRWLVDDTSLTRPHGLFNTGNPLVDGRGEFFQSSQRCQFYIAMYPSC